MSSRLDRRRFLGVIGGAASAGVLLGPSRAQLAALASSSEILDGYGPLGPADRHGVRLPEGFSSTLVARSGDEVGRTGLRWHQAPDGGACFRRQFFGHSYVSNSEIDNGGGGVSVLRFDLWGNLRSADRILSGTSRNCSGGPTPWGTWLSCEESGSAGQVWECDPDGGPAAVRPALGSFNHEAAAVDERRQQIFLTEDRPDGRLYRFRPAEWPDLRSGRLEAAVIDGDRLSWTPVGSGSPARGGGTAAFNGGEGAVIIDDSLFFATKGDRRIWELELESGRLVIFHDCRARSDTALTHVDNLAVHPRTGHLFVAEDGGDMDLCVLIDAPDQTAGPVVSRMVRFEGHSGSEVAGPAFSPNGAFLYLSSQRGVDGRGMTFQIRGPFAPPLRFRPPRRSPTRETPRPI